MDSGAWWATIHGVAKSWTQLSDFTFTFFLSGGSGVKNPPAVQEPQEKWVQSLGCQDPLEEGMATHSNILVWEIPWTEEPGGLQSMGSQKSRTQLSD